MIGDHYDSDHYDSILSPKVLPMGTSVMPSYYIPVSRLEFDELKRQVSEMKELLTKAFEYDKMTNQVECANDEKLARLEKIAEFVGIDCKELFEKLRSTHVAKPKKKVTKKTPKKKKKTVKK